MFTRYIRFSRADERLNPQLVWPVSTFKVRSWLTRVLNGRSAKGQCLLPISQLLLFAFDKTQQLNNSKYKHLQIYLFFFITFVNVSIGRHDYYVKMPKNHLETSRWFTQAVITISSKYIKVQWKQRNNVSAFWNVPLCIIFHLRKLTLISFQALWSKLLMHFYETRFSY